MALITVPTVVSTTSSKQIVIYPSTSTSIVYTVPAGKTFVGIMTIWSGAYPQVNGTYICSVTSWTSGQPFYYPLTLLAGSTVQNGSSSYYQWTLVGVES